jgi:hypothetical protein
MIFGIKIFRLQSKIHEYHKAITTNEYFFSFEIEDSHTQAKRTGQANTIYNKVE